MDGPYIELRVVDSSGNVIKSEGAELCEQWDNETLAEAFQDFEAAREVLDMLFEVEDMPEGPCPLCDAEVVEEVDR